MGTRQGSCAQKLSMPSSLNVVIKDLQTSEMSFSERNKKIKDIFVNSKKQSCHIQNYFRVEDEFGDVFLVWSSIPLNKLMALLISYIVREKCYLSSSMACGFKTCIFTWKDLQGTLHFRWPVESSFFESVSRKKLALTLLSCLFNKQHLKGTEK